MTIKQEDQADSLCEKFEKLTLSKSNDTRAKKKLYNQLVVEAKNLEKGERVADGLKLYQKAFQLFSHDEKLKAKIQKLEAMIQPQKNEQVNKENVKEVSPPAVKSEVKAEIKSEKIETKPKVETKVEVVKREPLKPVVEEKPQPSSSSSATQGVDEAGFYLDTKKNHYVLKLDGVKREYRIAKDVYEKLYVYQKECIKWLWEKHNDKSLCSKGGGGILGDDMGLGKTVQICAYLSGIFLTESLTKDAKDPFSHILIAMPVSVIENWRKEFEKWIKCDALLKQKCRPQLYIFHGLNTKKQREQMMKEFAYSGGVMITSYGMIASQVELFTSTELFDDVEEDEDEADAIEYDYIILDEGHKIKNPNIKISQSLKQFQSVHRIILTGTPVQNNLSEMWALYDYVFDGNLLGEYKTFKSSFEQKIVRAREKDASAFEKKLGEEVSRKLRELIDPYFLRREKSKVLSNLALKSSRKSTSKATQQISQKNDYIVWIKNSENQINVYKKFLESPEVRDVLNKSSTALAALTILKQICNHPLTLPQKHELYDLLYGIDAEVEEATNFEHVIENSGKIQMLDIILQQLKSNNHRVLIFSQSVKMIDIIITVLEKRKHSFLRIDGSVNDPKERQRLIDKYNGDPSIFCFLLTTQVGGIGLTLTGADRVVIFDPAWNPAVDNQAVDRAYRIGQTKNVIVYRFITCGTIEEKIYRKQVFKGLLSKTATDKDDEVQAQNLSYKRYFTHQELRELFTYTDPYTSDTQRLLQQTAKQHSKKPSYTELESELAAIAKLANKPTDSQPKGVMYGLSEHDTLFDVKEVDEAPAEHQQAANAYAEEAASKLFSPRGKVKVIPPETVPSKTTTAVRRRRIPAQGSEKTSGTSSGSVSGSGVSSASLSAVPVDTASEEFSSEEVENILKGVRLFGEGRWRQVAKEFNLKQESSSIEKMWLKMKKNKTQHEIVLMLSQYDEELKKLGKTLPALPKIRSNVIMVESSDQESSPVRNRVSSSSSSVLPVASPSRLLPVRSSPSVGSPIIEVKDTEPLAPVYTPPAIVDKPIAPVTTPQEATQTPIVKASTLAPLSTSPNTQDVVKSPIQKLLEETQEATALAEEASQEESESLQDVARRLSVCFGLLPSPQDIEDEDDELSPPSEGNQQLASPSKKSQKKRNIIYDSEEEETQDLSSALGDMNINSESPSFANKSPEQYKRLVNSSGSGNEEKEYKFDDDEDEEEEEPEPEPEPPGDDCTIDDDEENESDEELDNYEEDFIDDSDVSSEEEDSDDNYIDSDEERVKRQRTKKKGKQVRKSSKRKQVEEDDEDEEDEKEEDKQKSKKERYIQVLREARKAHVKGNLEDAISLYMDALALNDEDEKLHCTICELAKKLGFVKSN